LYTECKTNGNPALTDTFVCVVTNGKEFHECLAAGEENFAITCPPEEVITSVEVAFIADPNAAGGQCELNQPICTPTWTNDNVDSLCKGEQFCADNVLLYDDECDNVTKLNVARVTYSCSKGTYD